MTNEDFDVLLDELDKNSKYFHENSCSATFVNDDGATSNSLTDSITFEDADLGTKMQLNIGDAAYIFDIFLDLCPEAVEFFNKFIKYRGMEIVSCEGDELTRK